MPETDEYGKILMQVFEAHYLDRIFGNLFPNKDPRQDWKEMKKMSKELS